MAIPFMDPTDVLKKNGQVLQRMTSLNLAASVRSGRVLVNSVRGELRDSIRRKAGSSGLLFRSITSTVIPFTRVVTIGKGIVIGVGDTRRLPVYWAAIEFGLSAGFLGRIVPGQFASGVLDRALFATDTFLFGFQGTPNTLPFIRVARPIQPHRYFSNGEISARGKVLSIFLSAFKSILAV